MTPDERRRLIETPFTIRRYGGATHTGTSKANSFRGDIPTEGHRVMPTRFDNGDESFVENRIDQEHE